jgi:short-subunit dehydrogenase
VVLTGASRGLGITIAGAMARRGARLVLGARSRDALEAVATDLCALGHEAVAVPCDVTDPDGLSELVAAADALGGADVLVNNAGIERVARYETLDESAIVQQIAVNLTAPMLLTRRLLPGMLERGRGHVVNMASLAGLNGVAFNEPYGATKHAMVGFTRSLRASAAALGSPVSSTAVCPGFVDDVGMYADQAREHGARASRWLGTTTSEAVARAVITGIERDLPLVIVNPGPMKATLALGLLFPRFGEWVAKRIGAYEVFSTVSEARSLDHKRKP